LRKAISSFSLVPSIDEIAFSPLKVDLASAAFFFAVSNSC
jgi:hypothetical protein